MKYIIPAGTCFHLGNWKEPKHLSKINGEVLLARTIRQLKENGVTDIAITSMSDRLKQFDVPVINYDSSGMWVNAFMPVEEPVCYIFGDVYFSDEAIKTIVETETDSIEFFASAPPFSPYYPKDWAEPFAFKVVDTIAFRNAIDTVKQLRSEGKFRREPIAWELWQVIKGTPINHIDYTNFTVVNDYTSDLDYPADICILQEKLARIEDGRTVKYMIHTYPKRKWYVDKYLIPSMKAQGCENISVYVDEKGEGSLRAHMNAYLQLPDDNGGTWHLQDDVIICKDFAERTRQYNTGVVCGFSSEMYDHARVPGLVQVQDKWYSFPCIRIPNQMARKCANWVLQYLIGNAVYGKFWRDGKNEDWAFWTFVKDHYRGIKVLNLAPNLVNHVDYLIGGSANASKRIDHCVSQYWVDDDLVDKLKEDLKDAVDNN